MPVTKNNILIILAIIVLGFSVYSNSLSNGFTYDDFDVVAGNPCIRDASNLRYIFGAEYFRMFGEKTYRPLVTISYFLDYHLWGLKPWGYHLTNMFLHILAALLVYLLCNRIFGVGWQGLAAMLIFILHPVNTEAVNAVAFREEILFSIFFLASLLAYDKFARNSDVKPSYLYISLVLFILALFSKEHALVLPFIIVLYDYYFISGQSGAAVFKKLKYILIYVLIGVLFFAFARHLYAPYFARVARFYSNFFALNTFSSQVLTRLYVVAYYIKLLFVPVGLCADYFIKAVSSPFEARALIALVITGLSIVLALLSHKRAKYVSFGILWFYITLIPVANIFPVGNVMAERFLYLPTIGFAIALSWIICAIYGYLNKKARAVKLIFIFLAAGLFIFYAYNTGARNEVWNDNFILWQETVKSSPLSARAHNSLGAAYFERNDYDNAGKEYKLAINLYPFYAEAHNNLGSLYKMAGDNSGAIKELSIAAGIMPDNPYIRRNLAEALSGEARYAEAVGHLKKATEVDDNFERAHYDLAVAYEKLSYFQEAIEEYNKTLELNSAYSGVRFELGVLYYKLGRIGEARQEWRKALEITPGFEEAKEYLEKTK